MSIAIVIAISNNKITITDFSYVKIIVLSRILTNRFYIY